MKKLFTLTAMIVLLCVTIPAQAALVWNLSTETDYRWFGTAQWDSGNGGQGIVTGAASDSASILAKINPLAPSLKVGDITGGGYTVSGLNNPANTIYGSLYLSPTGGPGADVLILLSPMTVAGSSTLTYTFDLNTHADYRTFSGGWSAYDPNKSGTFAQVIAMINASAYNVDMAAFFGPQIGMSGTSGTTFTVSQIELQTVPIPAAVWLLGSGLVGMVALKRKFKP